MYHRANSAKTRVFLTKTNHVQKPIVHIRTNTKKNREMPPRDIVSSDNIEIAETYLNKIQDNVY